MNRKAVSNAAIITVVIVALILVLVIGALAIADTTVSSDLVNLLGNRYVDAGIVAVVFVGAIIVVLFLSKDDSGGMT